MHLGRGVSVRVVPQALERLVGARDSASKVFEDASCVVFLRSWHSFVDVA
jgi:hypothetical protein